MEKVNVNIFDEIKSIIIRGVYILSRFVYAAAIKNILFGFRNSKSEIELEKLMSLCTFNRSKFISYMCYAYSYMIRSLLCRHEVIRLSDHCQPYYPDWFCLIPSCHIPKAIIINIQVYWFHGQFLDPPHCRIVLLILSLQSLKISVFNLHTQIFLCVSTIFLQTNSFRTKSGV